MDNTPEKRKIRILTNKLCDIATLEKSIERFSESGDEFPQDVLSAIVVLHIYCTQKREEILEKITLSEIPKE